MSDDFMSNGTRERRARCLLGAVLLLAGVLTLRLYALQIGDGEHYRIQSEKNTMQPVPLEASRGLVRDRNGRILVDNRPSYTLSVIPSRLFQGRDPDTRRALSERLARIVDLSPEVVRSRLAKRKIHYYDPVKLKRDIRFETVSVVEEARYDLAGVEIQVEARRGYRGLNDDGPLAPHILGYVGLIDPDEYPRMASQGYTFDDQIGKRGIERLCERELRGVDGMKYIEVNAYGREVGGFPERVHAPVPGEDVTLTIDLRLQSVAEAVFGDSLKGSLVAMVPRTGEILAMVSKPDFHPGAVRNQEAWSSLRADPDKPLLNRTIQGEYAPGSVYKMILAVAALDMGITREGEIRYQACRGGYVFGDRLFRCHIERGHGALDLRGALIHSCDVYFYQLGREVGIANWARYARLFGFGQPTGIDIAGGGDGEAEGLVPDRGWYKKGRWAEGNMLNLSIGQGESLVTPLQIARYAAALATGALPLPHVLKASSPPPSTPVQVSAEALAAVRGMMRDVVDSGTGTRGRLPGIPVAGKTGTAQNPHGQDHAWFTAFAPVDDPQIVVTAFVEKGGHGGVAAAPLAQQVMKAWFEILQEDRTGDRQLAGGPEAGPSAGATLAVAALRKPGAPPAVLPEATILSSAVHALDVDRAGVLLPTR